MSVSTTAVRVPAAERFENEAYAALERDDADAKGIFARAARLYERAGVNAKAREMRDEARRI